MSARKSATYSNASVNGAHAAAAVKAGLAHTKVAAGTAKDAVGGFLAGFFGAFKQPEAKPAHRRASGYTKPAAKPAARKPAARSTKKASTK